MLHGALDEASSTWDRKLGTQTMGIAKGALSLLFELKTTTDLKGAVCELGRQTTYVTTDQIGRVAKKFGFDVTGDTTPPGVFDYVESVDDIQLFRALGFDVVESVDYSDYEEANHILDFNIPITQEFHERYDVIFDGGTLEHIFNFPECLKNIYRMLKPGGLVIHLSPSSNHVDHGFYMFSPTVFHDYYAANNYEIVRSFLIEYEPAHDTRPWIIYDYKPGTIKHLSYGGWGEKMLGIWFVARKLQHSTCNVTPQQGSCLRTWKQNNNKLDMPENQEKILDVRTRKGILWKVKAIAKSNKYTYLFAKAIVSAPPIPWIRAMLSRPRRPRIIARY